MHSKPPLAGFTLPEVLTSVTIVGLVLIALYSCWAAVLGATKSSSIAVQHIQRERAAIRAISDALGGVSWYQNSREDPLHLDDSFGFSHLKLISRVPPGFWGERELGDYPLRKIEFLTEDKPGGASQLVMIQQALLAPANSMMLHRTVLLPQVETFTIEVLPRKPSDNQAWLTSWPLFEARGLPLQAKVTLGAIEEFPRKSTLTIFANPAAHAKGPPAIGINHRKNDMDFARDGFPLTGIIRRKNDVDFADAGPPEDETASVARVIFILDKSGSMSGPRLAMAKLALMKSLRQMGQVGESDKIGKFYIYFFNHKSEAMPASAMLEATPANIQRMSGWLNSQEARSRKGTDPSDSIKSAFTHDPTELFLLTDGEFRTKRTESSVGDLLNALNPDKSVKINTFGVGEALRGEGETTLMLIAKENGGVYTFIDPTLNSQEPDFAAPPVPKQ